MIPFNISNSRQSSVFPNIQTHIIAWIYFNINLLCFLFVSLQERRQIILDYVICIYLENSSQFKEFCKCSIRFLEWNLKSHNTLALILVDIFHVRLQPGSQPLVASCLDRFCHDYNSIFRNYLSCNSASGTFSWLIFMKTVCRIAPMSPENIIGILMSLYSQQKFPIFLAGQTIFLRIKYYACFHVLLKIFN